MDMLCECQYHDLLWFCIDHDDPDWRHEMEDGNRRFQERLAARARLAGRFYAIIPRTRYWAVKTFGWLFKTRRSESECRELFGDRWRDTDWAELRALTDDQKWAYVNDFHC